MTVATNSWALAVVFLTWTIHDVGEATLPALLDSTTTPESATNPPPVASSPVWHFASAVPIELAGTVVHALARFATVVTPGTPWSPLGPCGPGSPFGPFGPAGSWPALKSAASSEPSRTFAELTAFFLSFGPVT